MFKSKRQSLQTGKTMQLNAAGEQQMFSYEEVLAELGLDPNTVTEAQLEKAVANGDVIMAGDGRKRVAISEVVRMAQKKDGTYLCTVKLEGFGPQVFGVTTKTLITGGSVEVKIAKKGAFTEQASAGGAGNGTFSRKAIDSCSVQDNTYWPTSKVIEAAQVRSMTATQVEKVDE